MLPIEKRLGIIDAAVNFSDDTEKELRVVLSKKTLHIIVLQNNKIVGIEVYSDKSDVPAYFSEASALTNIDLLRQTNTKISFSILCEKETLIPSEGFDPNMLEKYIGFNFGEIKNHKYFYDSINAYGINLVYALPDNLQSNLQNIFKDSPVKNLKSELIENFSKNISDEDHVFLNIREKSFDVFAYRSGALLLSNTFEYETAGDFIYFLMFAIKQIGFNPETLKLSLCGEIDKEGGIYNYIFKYVRHLSFIEAPDTLTISDELKELPFHYYFNILI